MQCAANSSGRVRLKEPRNDLASAVRELATMTASVAMFLRSRPPPAALYQNQQMSCLLPLIVSVKARASKVLRVAGGVRRYPGPPLTVRPCRHATSAHRVERGIHSR